MRTCPRPCPTRDRPVATGRCRAAAACCARHPTQPRANGRRCAHDDRTARATTPPQPPPTHLADRATMPSPARRAERPCSPTHRHARHPPRPTPTHRRTLEPTPTPRPAALCGAPHPPTPRPPARAHRRPAPTLTTSTTPTPAPSRAPRPRRASPAPDARRPTAHCTRSNRPAPHRPRRAPPPLPTLLPSPCPTLNQRGVAENRRSVRFRQAGRLRCRPRDVPSGRGSAHRTARSLRGTWPRSRRTTTRARTGRSRTRWHPRSGRSGRRCRPG